VAKLTRRESLAMTLGMIAAAGVSVRAGALRTDGGVSLHALALAGGSFNDANYARLLEADCGLLVPETELKWRAVRPSSERFDFSRFDLIIEAAEARGMAMRGHNLLWQRPQWMPEWAENYDFGANPGMEAERLLSTHVTTICNRYLGRIHSYDVVNEAVLPEDGTLAQTALSRAMGGTEALIDLAKTTRRVPPAQGSGRCARRPVAPPGPRSPAGKSLAEFH
jgi:endo-1,4-beta-xylanase